MKRRGEKTKILIAISFTVFLIVLLHTIISIVFAPLNIFGLGEEKISGITGKISFSPQAIQTNYLNLPSLSKLIIAAEWLGIIIIMLIVLITGIMKLRKEMKKNKDLANKNIMVKYTKSKSETDIDILYKILQQKKVLRLEAASKLFNVNKDTVMEWFKILEDGDLAEIHYPTVGSPKIILIEKVKNEEKEKK